MKPPQEAELLRIFIGEDDKLEGRPLYRAIVDRARERGLAGATVLRGMMGFGAHSRMHYAGILRISEDLPIIIEIVDHTEKIEAFAAEIDPLIGEGLMTLEKVRVLMYREGDSPED